LIEQHLVRVRLDPCPSKRISDEQLEEFLSTKAERLGYRFHVEQIGRWTMFTSFVAPADKPVCGRFDQGATGPDRKSVLQVLAYVLTNPGIKLPRGWLPP
jgi:hypothetical protein